MPPIISSIGNIALNIHICDLSSGKNAWSATISVIGPIAAQGMTVGIFYEGHRLLIDTLDEWGYLIAELNDLPPPYNLIKPTFFEVRTKSPPHSFTSTLFHPPVVNEALREFLERTRSWPKALPLRGAQLQGVSLGQSNLQGVDLTGANLTGAKFWGADLTGAILKDAVLDQVDFNTAKLDLVDLQGSSLNDIDWTKTTLKGADLRAVVGLSSEVMIEWGDLVTLDETQQARVKLLQLAQKQDHQKRNSAHYRSPVNTLTTSSEHTAAKIPSPAQQSNADSINRHGEQTFYRSPKGTDRQKKHQVEEDYIWSPKLPPIPSLSDEEVEQHFQTERLLYKRKLEKYQQTRVLRGNISFNLNMVPNGSFEMGHDEGETKWRPRHKVTMTYPLLVGETVVTQELFSRVMMHTNFKFSGALHPAESLSWSEAIDFCNRLSQLEGLKPAYVLKQGGINWDRESNGYRLPTEAEWEYFARASVPSLYAGSNDVDQVAWYKANSEESTQAVAQKRPNAWGLYDISGNIWEWCYDTYLEDCFHDRGATATVDPIVSGDGPKVIRGGSWSYDPEGLTLFYRSRLAAKFKTSRVGFRVVRSPKLKSKSE